MTITNSLISAAPVTTIDKAQEYSDNQGNTLIAKLPREVIILILSYLRPSAISALSLSGKHFNLIPRDDQLWRFLFTSRFQMPIPNGTCLEAYKKQHLIHQNITNGVYASHALQGHVGGVCSVALGDGRLFSGSLDTTIKIWDLEKNLCIETLEEHGGSVYSVAFADGWLYSGSEDRTIKIWDLEKNLSIETLKGHRSTVYSVALGSKSLFSGSFDKTIKIWDLGKNLCIETLKGHGRTVYSVAFAEGKLFSGSSDKTVKIWDLEKNICTQTLKGHEKRVYSVASGSRVLFSGSSDTTIKIWDLETSLCIQTLEGHENSVNSLALGNGRLFSGSSDKTIKIWDLEKNLCLQTLKGHEGAVYSIVFAEGKLFSGSSDNTIRIWDFSAPDSAIFAEIAGLFRSNPKEAMERFSCMPKKARNEIYSQLHHILNPLANDDMGCAEDAFHDQNGQKSTPEQKAQAIENYLKSVGV